MGVQSAPRKRAVSVQISAVLGRDPIGGGCISKPVRVVLVEPADMACPHARRHENNRFFIGMGGIDCLDHVGDQRIIGLQKEAQFDAADGHNGLSCGIAPSAKGLEPLHAGRRLITDRPVVAVVQGRAGLDMVQNQCNSGIRRLHADLHAGLGRKSFGGQGG